EEASTQRASRVPAGALGAWWREGARTAMLRRPRWSGLHAQPVLFALLLATWLVLSVLLQRMIVPGPGAFNASAVHTGRLGAPPRRALRACVVLASGVPLALNLWAQPPSLWQADDRGEQVAAAQRFRVTQELIERQAPLLPEKLQQLQPQRPGVVDLYALTFA